MHDRQGGASDTSPRVTPSLSGNTTSVWRWCIGPPMGALFVYVHADEFSHCCSAVAHFEAHRSLSSSSSSSLCFRFSTFQQKTAEICQNLFSPPSALSFLSLLPRGCQ